MRKKIFIAFMLLAIIGAFITGFFTSQLAQTTYKDQMELQLKNATLMIKHQLVTQYASETPDYNALASTYAKVLRNDEIHTAPLTPRITFIDNTGDVLGESNTDYHAMENHYERKEIVEALQGQVGQDIRFSNTLHVNYYYLAIQVPSHNVIVRVALPMTQISKTSNHIWLYSIIGIIAGLLTTALMAFRFSSGLTQPIHQFISISREIAQGNYARRVRIHSRDELGILADTFNDMAEKLDRTVDDLTDKNIKLDSILNSMSSGIVAVDNRLKIMLINAATQDMFSLPASQHVLGCYFIEVIRNHQIYNLLKESVTNNTSLSGEITLGKPQEKIFRITTNPIRAIGMENSNAGGIVVIQDITNIKKLEQIRTEFVSNVTHELKTPLTSIRGFIETLRNGAISDTSVADKFLEIIDIEAERLYILINDILQLSEIESRQNDSNVALHDLQSILEETLPVLQPVAEKKKVQLYTEITPPLPLMVNKNRIKQLLINLIDNAIKYNHEEGAVYIKAWPEHDKIHLSIRDTGIGIEADQLPRIFERFYRVDKGRSRSMGGTGLGLSIVKHIVNFYGGELQVKSKPGEGTEFIIQFPMKKDR